MTEETKARIFEPFFSTKEHGIGLGFATTYGIVASWDGTISVTSDPGHGTCFEIRFPRVEPPSAEEVKDHELRTAQGVDALSLVTVLLVDDEPSVRTFTPRVLERAGCEVVEAGTGEEALRLLESDPTKFDLILTDVVMPIMGGYELAAEAARVRPGLPTVLMSGYLDSRDAQASVVGDDLPFIGKPFRFRDLLRVLGEAMNPN